MSMRISPTCFKIVAWLRGKKAENAFTLVELLSVVAIISILAAIAIPSYKTYILQAEVERSIVEIKMIEKEIDSFKSDNEKLPGSLSDIGFGGLQDPWGNPYRYLNIADGGVKGKGKLRRDRFMNPLNTDYDLYSMGPDGVTSTNLNAEKSRDDIVRANSGAFIGVAADF